MATLNGSNAELVVILSSTSLAFAAHHTYKFDQWRCLYPRKKEWFRVLLTWMLLLCNLGMFVWGCGWTYVKYKVGFITLPVYGAVPVPAQLWKAEYKAFNTPLTVMLNLSYALQAALNAEEGLYWYHLMRAVRQPKSAKSWLNSNFFYAWIAISLVCAGAQFAAAFATRGGTDADPSFIKELGRELTCGGVIELVVLASASIVLIKFPAFLQDVKASGAGPEVRSRLHFYHEANKVRTFFRLVFAGCLLTLGIDGLTKKQTINMMPLPSDLLIQICLGSYFLVLMISMMLYLPRNYSSAPRTAQVFVANNNVNHTHNINPINKQHAPRTRLTYNDDANLQLTSGHALMSLLREGGQWDEDDDLRAGYGGGGRESAPFERTKSWSGGTARDVEQGKERDGERGAKSVPFALEHFTSPIAVQTGDHAVPRELKIQIQQEIHTEQS